MAPRRDNGEYIRQPYRHSSRVQTPFRRGKGPRSNPTVFEDDGDVLMTGCRIPTKISSKGAIQHKLDRYAPHKGQVSGSVTRQVPDKGHGHKRYGGRYDESRHNHGSLFEQRSVDEHNQRYGDEYKEHQSYRADGQHNYSNHERSSRHDRHAREYHLAVTSSRSRYEHDGARYRPHTSFQGDRHERRYNSIQYHRNFQYPNEYSPSHSYPRTDPGRSYTFPSHDQSVRGEVYRTSYTDHSQQWTHSGGSYEHNHMPNPGFEGGFEGAMKSLASHAERFLKNVHWQDREEIEAAVWKAYGDSIASLGYRKSRGLSENRPRGWISINEITNRGGDFEGVPRGPKSMPGFYRDSSRHSNVPHRNRVLENYRKANEDYERTLNELFGGNSPHYTAYNTHPDHGSTNCIQQDVPRPKPPAYQIPVYIPDPKDPMRFINVPRPPVRQQWHIPADYYNGKAWAQNRKREIETGAFPNLYPDKWLSGDSFGDTTKDSEFRVQQIRGDNIKEGVIGRDCYAQDASPSPVNARFRSQSLDSELGHNFNSIHLHSASPSLRESSRACSELPEDFDLYGPPVQSITSQNEGQIGQDDDGSLTPRQHTSPPECSFSLNLMSKEDSIGDRTAADDYYQLSRETTPTLRLAEYITNTSVSSLKNNINLIDIASSAPPSPKISRSDTATPSYYSKVNYSPLRSRNEPREPQPKQNIFQHKGLAREDWDSSFHSVASYNKKNPVFIVDEEVGAHCGPGIKEGMLVDLNSPAMRSDAETDDDLDFLGVEFFST